MKFVRENENTNLYIDSIFSIVQAAKADPQGINATAGCLYDDEGKLFTFSSVYDNEKKLSDAQKASYASSPAGNPDYISSVEDFVLAGKVNNHHRAMATPGGTGAIATATATCLQQGDTILFPDIAWGNYQVIADEGGTMTYDVYDLGDLFTRIDSFAGKVFLVVNSPCENPLGFAYSFEQWQQIIDKLNSLNKEVILLCDIAYIDYANGEPKNYFSLFNKLDDNVLVLLAASCSKAFSYYGQRLGLLIAINNDEQFLDHYINLCTRYARSTWSNPNNAGMLNIAMVLSNDRERYENELAQARKMLKQRVDLFIRQADECGLEYYKLSDGFFVTLVMEDNKVRDNYHARLIAAHIYTIKVNKGIRLGLCSLPLKSVDGLAYRLKELM